MQVEEDEMTSDAPSVPRDDPSREFRGVILSTKVDEEMARGVAQILGAQYVDPGIHIFENSEIGAEIQGNVRQRHTFLIGSTCRDLEGRSTNDAIMQTMVVVDALLRASARSITLVIPYFGYQKQERKKKGRQPISAKLIMNMFEVYKPTLARLILMDLHAPAIQGFPNLPVDNVSARPELIRYLKKQGYRGDKIIVVSPDAGGVERAREFSTRLSSKLAIMSKLRSGHDVHKVESTELIGDVRDKIAVVIDDMVMTGGTLFAAAGRLLEEGATKVVVCATHGDLCGDVVSKLQQSLVDELIITNTVPLSHSEAVKSCGKIKVISIYDLLAKTIRRNYFGDSVSKLFD